MEILARGGDESDAEDNIRVCVCAHANVSNVLIVCANAQQ